MAVTQPSGERAPWTKLTDADVRMMREMAAASDSTVYELAQLFHVAAQTVSDLITGRERKEAGGPFRATRHYQKLTPERAADIRQKYQAGMSQTTLAAEYGVRRATISLVVNRKTYR